MKKAENLKLGAIYINAATGETSRLTRILPCEGAWLETYDGQGIGETVSFENVHYANTDEVNDFIEDVEAHADSELVKS